MIVCCCLGLGEDRAFSCCVQGPFHWGITRNIQRGSGMYNSTYPCRRTAPGPTGPLGRRPPSSPRPALPPSRRWWTWPQSSRTRRRGPAWVGERPCQSSFREDGPGTGHANLDVHISLNWQGRKKETLHTVKLMIQRHISYTVQTRAIVHIKALPSIFESCSSFLFSPFYLCLTRLRYGTFPFLWN